MFESNIARYSALVRRLFSIKGEVPLNVDALGIPTFPLLDGPPELGFLRSEMLAQGFTTQIAVAARFTFIYIDSPVKLARIERVYLFPDVALSVRVECGATEPNNAIVGAQERGVRDNRLLPAVPSVRILSNTSAAQIVVANFTQFDVNGGLSLEVARLEGPWVLGPETGGLIFEVTDANVSLNLNAIWTERPFEAGER